MKRGRRNWIALPAALAACASLFGMTARAGQESCRVVEKDFEGWKAVEVSNSWVTLTIVPRLGGRVMQVEFDGHAYLFVNPRFKGKYIPPSEGAAKGKWFNYGGDKIWPMPEGDEDANQWPGPIADPLDDGEYQATIVSQGETCRVRLDGPVDERTGLEYSREISLTGGSPEIAFHAVMKNAAAHPIEWSVQSVTQYDLSDPKKPEDYNHDFWAYTPANPSSAYLDGFHVRSGLAEDPSFSVANGFFTLHWMYLQNEVWIDSPGSWLAVLDRLSGFAMVERFTVHAGANYPGKATVIFYKNGPAVEMNAAGMPEIRTNVEDAPFYMEAEINSPIVKLSPGDTYAMDTKWLPTHATGKFSGVNDAGIVGEPLSAKLRSGKLQLTGSFGVFFAGRLEARMSDSGGRQLGSEAVGSAQPQVPVVLGQEVPAPAGVARVAIHLIDAAGSDCGILGIADVAQAEGGK